MATLDLSEYDAMLKEYYTDEMVRRLAYTDNVLLGILPKKQYTGDQIVQPVDFGKPGNASAVLSTARTNATHGKWVKFVMTEAIQYQPAFVATRLIMASKNNVGAFEPAFQVVDNAHTSLSEKLNRHLYRTTTGSIGRIATNGISSATITLTDKADVWNFEPGDVLQMDDADGGGSVHSGTVTVLSVDPEAGTVTMTGNVTAGISSAAAGDYVFHAGDYDACAAGAESWIPTGSGRASALAASFFGVTRSTHGERLGGIYLDATTSSFGDLNEVLVMLVSRIVSRGGKPNVIILHPDRFAQLQLLWLSKQIVFENITVNVSESVGGKMVTFGVAYSGMRANIGGQIITVLQDRCCPTRKVLAFMTKTWRVWHYGSSVPCFPRKEVGSGEGILKELEASDAYEARIAAYYQLGCSAPGWNGAALLPAL